MVRIDLLGEQPVAADDNLFHDFRRAEAARCRRIVEDEIAARHPERDRRVVGTGDRIVDVAIDVRQAHGAGRAQCPRRGIGERALDEIDVDEPQRAAATPFT